MKPEQLLGLWTQYREARRPELAPTTYGRGYGDILKRIQKLSEPSEDQKPISSGREYRTALLATYSHETARRTLQQLNACCKWAIEEELLEVNPFEGVKIRKPKRPPVIPDAYTSEEMDVIIGEIGIRSPHYLPWVQALFWLAARPEELRALRWEHLSRNGKTLKIREAWPMDAEAPQNTKNYRHTNFPLNTRLQKLFAGLRPSRARRQDWIFKSELGQPFNYANFQRRHWRPAIEELLENQLVSYYGTQYDARHTGITLMLQSGLEVEEVAYLARTSRKIIYEYYLGLAREITVPEF